MAFSKKIKPKAKKLDLSNPEDVARLKRRKERLKKMKNTTRWLPNTAFTTYFGKPTWGPYGYGNINPTNGGLIYGQHMLSHNVQPHRCSNNPNFPQSYNNAIRFASNVAEIEPEPPRKCKDEDRMNQKQIQVLMERNPLTPQPYETVKKNITTSKGKQ